MKRILALLILLVSLNAQAIDCQGIFKKFVYDVQLEKAGEDFKTFATREEVTGASEVIFQGVLKFYQTGDGENGYWFNMYSGADSKKRKMVLKFDSTGTFQILSPESVTLTCK